MSQRVGVLALQGGYQPHIACMEQLGVEALPVRHASDLERCTALILPGGESTSMSRLIEARGLLPALTAFAGDHPVFGTCAGLILMARCGDPRVLSLELLDVEVARNAYGRQAHSFRCTLRIDLDGTSAAFPGIFIRAPQIGACAAAVDVLACWEGQPVLVAQGPHMGMSFHPELAADARLHAVWLARAQAFRATGPHRKSA